MGQQLVSVSRNSMRFRLAPLYGNVAAVACFCVAALLHPGAYDWNRDYVSTLLRGDPGPARIAAIAGLLAYCTSMAVVFVRLARSVGPSKSSDVIRIGGIGSMVYSVLTITSMHDLMVTISIPFFVVAMLALLRVLYVNRDLGFLAAGIACLALLIASVMIYYTGQLVIVLPWAQRILSLVLAIWLIALDLGAARLRSGASIPVRSA